jgi:hypothetical protein
VSSNQFKALRARIAAGGKREASELKGLNAQQLDEIKLAIFEARLREANATYQSRVNDGRDGALGVVCAVNDYLQLRHPHLSDDLAPLAALANALRDLDHGVQPNMLAPAQRSANRPPNEIGYAYLRGISAAAVTILMEMGKGSEKDVGKEIAQALHDSGFRQADGKAITHITIRNWRRDLMRGAKQRKLRTREVDVREYLDFIATIRKAKISDKEVVEIALELLRRYVPLNPKST